MNEKKRIFLTALIASFSFFWAVNLLQQNLEGFLLARELEINPPSLFTAQLNFNFEKKEEPFKPERPENCSLEAENVLAITIDKAGQEELVFEKKAREPKPIASLTKLMTAIIVLEFYPPGFVIKISQEAVNQKENIGNLKVGEEFSVENLVKMALIESSNDAAFALTEPMGKTGFVGLMNLKAKSLGLTDTAFVNAHGLDPSSAQNPGNIATAWDLAVLSKYLLNKKEILAVISKKEEPLYKSDGQLHHILENTNILLEELPELIGGKTGFTDQAGGCLLTIAKTEEPEVFQINVVLNSPDRFADMRKLLTCASFQ